LVVASIQAVSIRECDESLPLPQAERLERQWPRSAAALLLRLAMDEAHYEQPLFDAELAQCRFAEYPIDTWSRATLAVGGLFYFLLPLLRSAPSTPGPGPRWQRARRFFGHLLRFLGLLQADLWVPSLEGRSHWPLSGSCGPCCMCSMQGYVV
jgi:hypothetical protein